VNAIFGFNSVTLKVMGKIRLMVMLNIFTPIIMVVLNLLLIPHFGAMGAAVATTAGLVLQCLFRQLALWLGCGINFFEMRYAAFFLLLGGCALGLYFIQFVAPSNVYFGIIMASAASVLVLSIVKEQLEIADTFPEILRLPLLGRLLA
jgi:O-antigen/teichoic acid export membrane protein